MGTTRARKANKTIEVRVHFWTNDIAPKKGEIEPGHCWGAGAVHVTANKLHELRAVHPPKFNSMAELPAAIEQAMIAAGITLHAGNIEKRIRHPKGGKRPR